MEARRQEVVDEGYTVLPAQVAEPLRTRALRAINRRLGGLVQGESERALGGEAAAAARSLTNGLQLPELMADPAIVALLNASGVLDTLTELSGSAERMEVATHGQIALRFPGDLCIPGTCSPQPWW